MITPEHFEVLRTLRQEANNLCLTCISVAGASSLVHMAFDRGISRGNSRREDDLLRKIK